MKKVLLLMVCALMSFALYAQVSDNFSDYTVGGKLAQQAQAMGKDYWTTWSNAPGGAEDGVIAEVSGNKALFLNFGNDQILKLGDKTSGVWQLTFKFNVPAGKDGYFNVKSVFPSTVSETWAFQVYLATDEGEPGPHTEGQGRIYAGSETAVPFNFTHGTWVPVKVYIDLDNDDAEFYINETLVHSWTYSLGSFGQSNHKFIAAMNMFPPNGTSTSSFYIDDIVFEQGNMEVLYTTCFDDKPNGSKVAQSYPDWWTTWNNAPGGPEDGTISNEQSSTSPQSAKLVWDNDLMFKAGDKTTGAYTYDLEMYIPTNGNAYFNVLHFFDPGNGGQDSEWAVGVYFNVSASGMPAGTNVQQNGTLYPFTFPFNTWFPISIYINLDVDLATIKINGTQVLEWQFSVQENGGVGTKQFGRVDFYPPQSGSVYYIDNVVYAKAGDPPPPPVLSVMPEELTIKLKTNETKSDFFHIVSEETGTLKASWSTYIDYSPLETGSGPSFTLTHCDTLSAGADGIGYSEAFQREIGMKLKPKDYKDQLGGMLKKIAFYIYPAHSPGSNLTFRVYGQGPAENVPGEILAEKVLPMGNFVAGAWNWVDITPLQLTGGEYWVTVAMLQAANTFPLTVDGGPAVEDGDWLKTGNGGWGRLSSGGTLNYNFAIQAKGDGKVSKMWGALDQAYGITFSGEISDIKTTVNSAGFPDLTTCTANIVIVTNVAAYPHFDIPLTMMVNNNELSNDVRVKEVTVDGVVAPTATGTYDFRMEIVIDEGKETVEIVVTPEYPAATVTGDIGEQPVKATLQGQQNVYSFTVTAEDGKTTQDYKLLVFAKLANAISEIDNAVQLYPNPVADYLYLKSDVAIDQVTIYNLTGKVVKQIEQPSLSIDLSDFASGIYLLRVSTSQGETMKKFIKE